MNAHGMPVRILVTEATRSDCHEACKLIEGIDAANLFVDRAYDTNEIVGAAQAAGFVAAVQIRCIAL